MRHALHWHIALPYATLILVTAALLTFVLVQMSRRLYLDDLDSRLYEEATLIAAQLAPILAQSATAEAVQPQVAVLISPIQTRVTVVATDGRVLGDSSEDPLTMENHATRPEIQDALAKGIGRSDRYTTTVGYTMRYMAVPVRGPDGQPLGVVRVALPLREIDANVRRLMLTASLIGAGAAVIGSLIGLVIASRIARPVRELMTTARAIAAGKLDQRVRIDRDDEIGHLAHTFNEMANRLNLLVRQLREEGATMAAVLSTMSDGVCVTDQRGTLQLVNDAALRLFGTDREHTLGRSLIEVSLDHEMAETLHHCLNTGQPQTRLIERPDDRRILRLLATPLQSDGNHPSGALVVLQDLTDLRRLETVRRDFVANISHELRTPLATAKALVETLEDSALTDPKLARHFLTKLHGEIDRMVQMVQELLDLSRIESGQSRLTQGPVAPGDLVAEAVDRLHGQITRAGLLLDIHIPHALPPVLADREQIIRVLTNLIHNAIKFTPAGGRITVSTEPQEQAIRFSVADTGIGINAADLPRIFERFYKADPARSGSRPDAASSGSGLGLAIAKHIVQAHGGQIWAQSQPGTGTTIFFSLPLAQAVPLRES